MNPIQKINVYMYSDLTNAKSRREYDNNYATASTTTITQLQVRQQLRNYATTTIKCKVQQVQAKFNNGKSNGFIEQRLSSPNRQ